MIIKLKVQTLRLSQGILYLDISSNRYAFIFPRILEQMYMYCHYNTDFLNQKWQEKIIFPRSGCSARKCGLIIGIISPVHTTAENPDNQALFSQTMVLDELSDNSHQQSPWIQASIWQSLYITISGDMLIGFSDYSNWLSSLSS